MTAATAEAQERTKNDPALLARILEEGWGEGAWHGPDLKTAVGDVSPELAFWRPGPGRHNIAEIALHHAYCVRGVRAQLSGETPEPFLVEGEDWFEVSESTGPSWESIRARLEEEQARLRTSITGASAEPFPLLLGITCHAIYHAGQIQLLKRLHAS